MNDIVYAMGSPTGGNQQPSAGQQGGPAGIFTSFLPLIIIMFIFYFLLIRPQQKQKKIHNELLSKLKKGDKVITSGGIHGVVVGINDKESIVVLRIDENVKVEVSRAAISTVKGTEEVKPA